MLTPLSDADDGCGRKAANLGRLIREGYPVPAGFVVRDALADRSWPDELAPALRSLGGGPCAVRSSTSLEDGADVSFAGQFETTLNVTTAARVTAEVRRIACAGAEPRARAYAARTGQVLAPGAVPVIVQRMVPARVAGILFTRHPVTAAEEVVVEAARGLGDVVADGVVTPCRWVVARDGSALRGPDGGSSPLTAAEIESLRALGLGVEASFGCALDIEWAIEGETVWVLQARPATTRADLGPSPSEPAAARIVVGTPASPGRATGRVRVVVGLDDFASFAAGDVLVCRSTSPAWTPLLARAAAVVTEVGGLLSHAAIVAREFGIPAVTAADGAIRALPDGLSVAVDGSRGTVAEAARPGAPGATP